MSRRRRPKPSVSAYADEEGNVLELRDEITPGTMRLVREPPSAPGSSAEDRWQRREEMLFERLAVRWTIADLPLERQDELLGRYRFASPSERAWVRRTIDRHLEQRIPGLR